MFIRGKKAEHFRYTFKYDDEGTDIYDVYGSPSYAKVQAFENCRKKCAAQGGYHFCILSHNTFCFTCGWLTQENGVYILHVETPKNSYEMEYSI